MTPHQIKIMEVLKASSDWITIADLVNRTGIQNSVMHKCMESACFANVERGYRLMQLRNKKMDVKIYRLASTKSNVNEALALAKKFKGVYGQLFWSANGHKANTTQS